MQRLRSFMVKALVAVPLALFLLAWVFPQAEDLLLGLMMAGGVIVGPVVIYLGLKWETPVYIGVTRDDMPRNLDVAARGLGGKLAAGRIAVYVRRFAVSWPLIGLCVYERGLVIDLIAGPKIPITRDQIRSIRSSRDWFGFTRVEITHECPSIRSPLIVGVGPIAGRRVVPLLLEYGGDCAS